MKHTLYNNTPLLRSLRLFVAVLCLIPMTSSAQTMARYSVTQSTGNSYSSISVSGAAIPSWRNISGGNFNLDDNRSYPVDIGFDFWYRGERYTQFSVSTNGYIDFNASTANGGPTTGAYGYDNAAFTNNTNLTATALAVFYDDQTTQGVTDPLGEGIKYSTSGVAPNRVLTVEWINMAVYGNTAPDLNYQVKLFESSGEIQYNYSTMTAGGATYSYTIGLNGPTQTATAAASELLTQQTANGSTFNNTERNNLATLPISGYRYAFAPPAMNAPHTLSFSGVSQNSMTLNWTDTLWNEVGFVVYASSDGGATYNFIAQTAADVTSYALTGLLAGTTYYVKVYAVNEGRLSSALTGSQATLSAGAPYSISSGSWKNSAIWSTGSVPGISDNATIANGTIVTIDSTVTVNSLTVGQGTSGTLLIGNDNTARSITVIGNITVNSGAVFRVNAASNTSSHTITTSGNIDNSGIFVMAPDANSRCAVTFNKNGTQTISGAGDSTFFYLMTVNLGSSRSNMLDIFATNFADTTVNFLTLTNGTFNLATGATITPFTAATTITSTAGLRVNHSSAVLNTRSGSLTVAGEFKLTAGTVTIGSSTAHDLISTGGIFEVSGGTLTVRGGFIPSSAYATTKFTMSGGTMTVADSGSTNTTYSPMNMSVAGSEFTMSGGTIIIKKEGGTGAQDLGFSATGLTSYSVTGGTIQFGSGLTPAAQTMRLNSSVPLYNLTVNSSNATVQLMTNNVTIQNNVTISAGTLNLNALTLSIAKDWSNSGTLTAATGKVIFNGSGAQSITDAGGETFNRLTINKASGTVTMVNNVTVSDSFALTLGTLDVAANTLQLDGIVTGGGTLTSADAGTVNYNRNVAGQAVLAANYGNLTFSSFTKVLPASTIGISNVFSSGTAAGHTITGNTIDYNGSGAQNISAFLYNNMTLSNGGVKTQLVGADTVLGTLSIGASNTLTVSSADTMRIFGNVVNAGVQNGTNYLELRGSTVQSVTGGGSFNNLKINNANGITLSGNTTVNGVLRLLTGVISTGTDTLTISSSGSVSRNSGHVNGWLKKNFSAGSSVTRTYELGDAAIANYTPIVFNFATVSGAGNVAVTTVASEPDNLSGSFIDPTNNVNRYWQAVNSGSFAYTVASGCSITVTFLNSGDLDQTGTETSFRMNVYNGTRWDSVTAGTRTTTTNMATGVDSLGIYVVGLQSVTNSYRTKGSGRWTQWWNTWERFNGISWVNATTFPKLADGLISVQAGHTVTIDTTLSGATNGLDQLYIEAGGQITVTTGGTMQLRNGAGTDLTVLGTLLLSGTGSITTNGTPTITVASGGVYSHNVNGGNIISANAYTATWNAASTVEITGVTTTVPAKINQTFGNFIWKNSSQSAAIALLGNPATVNGNFDIQRTNNQQLLLNDNTSATKTIGGKFAVRDSSKVVVKSTGATAYAVSVGDSLVVSGTGSVLRFLTGGGTGTVTMTVAGHTLMAGDSLLLSGTATVDSLRVSGNFTHSSGVITETSTGAGWIIFQGNNQQEYTSGGTVSNTINYRVDGASWLKLGPTATLTGGGAFTLVGSGKLEIGSVNGIASSGATGNIQVTGTRTFSSTAKYIYSGTSSQIQGVFTTAPTARTVNYLEVNNAAGMTLSDSLTVTDSLKLVNGTFGIGSMTLYITNVAALTSGTLTSNSNGTVNYNKGSNTQAILAVNYGHLILSNFNKTFPASTVGIAGAFTPGSATGHTVTGNTIDYNGSGAQTVRSWAYYNNLSVTGTNWKQLTGNVTVNGNLSVANGTLSDSIYTLTVKGNISNTSLNTGYATGKTVLTSGTVSHALSGAGTYRILEMNDAYGATVSSNLTIDSLLILTNGVISAGANVVICSSYPGVTRTNGHIFGTLQKVIEVNPTPQLYTFQVGDAANYTPIDVTFQSVTVGGTLQAKQTTPDHPNVKFSGLDEYKSVNRYFTLTGSGITFSTYDATMNFVSGDIDAGANTGYFFVKRYNASWNPSTTNIRNSTSTKTTGITGFGEFAVGEAATTFYWTKGAGTFNWGDDYNWSSHSVPTAGNSVVFDGKDTIEVNVNAVCNNLTLQNDTLILTIRAGKTLSVSGNLAHYSGLFSTREAFPTVTGSISLTGGTFGYDSSAGTQTVAVQSYHHLQITGGGTKTAAGPFTVNHNLTIGSGATFADGGATITVKDSIANNGQHTGAGMILLDGAVQHRLSGSGSFTNLQLNNSSNGATVSGNITFNGALTLTSGIITALTDTIGIASAGSIVRTSGFVYGNLKKYFAPAADSLSFEVGTASVYLPVTVSFGTVTTGGSLTLQMIGTEHPDISNSGLIVDSTVNRYWILKNNGIAFNTVNVTFNWLSGDLDPGIVTYTDLLVTKKDNGVWSDAAIGTITSTSIRAMSLTSFSEFAIGKASSDLFTSVATGNWSTAATWDQNRVPKKRDMVRIVSPHVVTMVDDREINSITVNSGAEFADGGYTLDLYGLLSLSGRWSGTGRIRWNDSDADSLAGTGGKVSGTSTLYISGTGKLVTAVNDTMYRIQIGTGNTVTNHGTIYMARLIGDNAAATWINAAGSSLFVSDTLLATGTLTATASPNTVTYYGTGAQSIMQTNYHHLTISGSRGANSITLPSGTVTVAGTFSSAASFSGGGFISTGNTIDYNGSGAQTVAPFDYRNLTVSGARGGSAVTFSSSDTIAVSGTLSLTATAVSYSVSGSIVDFNGTTAQSVPAFNYHSLRISGNRTTASVTLAASDTIGVADSLSFAAVFSSGGYTTTGSKIAFNGTGTQTIPAFSYNDLSISGTRNSGANVVFAPSDTIKISGVLAVSAAFSGGGSLVSTASTVDFNGTSAQYIPALSYHNMRISGTRSGANSVTLAPGTINVAGNFSPAAVFGTGDYIVTSNTLNFNGGTQTIPAFRYTNVQVSNAGTKTAGGTLRVQGNMTIGASADFNAGATTDTVYGTWTNSGTFTPATSTVVFAGTPSTTVTGATTFNTLVVNKQDSATAVTLANSIAVTNLTMTSGTMHTGANSVTVTGTRTGNGIILGTVTRTHTFSLSTVYAFEGPNSTVTFTAGTPPSSVTMTTAQTAPSSPTFVAVGRSVNIALTGGSGLTSTLRLHYENTEANSLNENIMKLWQHSGSWQNRSSSAVDSSVNYVEMSGLTASIAGDWGIGSSVSTKTVSDINGGTANAGDSLLYTISITNPYNVTKNSILVTDPLDNNLIVKSGTISNSGGLAGTSNNGNGSLVGGTISWPALSLASGATTTRTFKVNTDSLMDVSEAVNNTATIDFGGSNIENVSASITITNIANIAIDTNIVSHQSPVPGDTLVFTLKYRNTGTSNATSVTATYTIPGNTSFVSNGYGAAMGIQVNGSPKTNATDADEVTVSGSTITVTIPTLVPGAYEIVKFKTIVN